MVQHVRNETVVLAQLELRILAFRSRTIRGETERIVVVGREQDERGIRNERGGVHVHLEVVVQRQGLVQFIDVADVGQLELHSKDVLDIGAEQAGR